jgi:hypothetical protein
VNDGDFWHNCVPHPEFRPVSSTPTRQRRYVTWRLPDRHFSKVHLVGEPGLTICGRALPRATGQPKAPIPDSEMCPDCDAQG